jgi:hypothetical protein
MSMNLSNSAQIAIALESMVLPNGFAIYRDQNEQSVFPFIKPDGHPADTFIIVLLGPTKTKRLGYVQRWLDFPDNVTANELESYIRQVIEAWV